MCCMIRVNITCRIGISTCSSASLGYRLVGSESSVFWRDRECRDPSDPTLAQNQQPLEERSISRAQCTPVTHGSRSPVVQNTGSSKVIDFGTN